ncbi:MAG: patatin-like protein [Novosphingobium sp.]|nr:patatin-like protein [Novosphingobium sp.]
MRQKELRIALVCYGGVSLAVYMHGVTKELWKLTRASRAIAAGADESAGVEQVYRRLLQHIETRHAVRLRVMVDVIAGASAGGLNGVFLAQAIHSGQSLEPLTRLWLECADVDVLLDPDARPWSRFAKFWALPLVGWMLRRPDNVVSASVAPETRAEVRAKLSRLIRSRWFEAPFGGLGFSRLIADALTAMADSREADGAGLPLLPAGHPLDLFVTATDFKGHMQALRLHSPPLVQESEHRLSIGFRAVTPAQPGGMLAPIPELCFAARATASFPGAFPALQIAEIDALAAERGIAWPTRTAFIERIMPEHAGRGTAEGVSLIDGSVLVNAPFAEAMGVLADRPAQREVDRRFVYIDPRPDKVGGLQRDDPSPPGWFSVIFGSLSSIPREQPVRDNLEELARQSRERVHLREIVQALRPEVETTVEKLFGHTLFLDRPTAKRLANWRAKAQQAAAAQSGFAWHGYARVKFAGVVGLLAGIIHDAAPGLSLPSPEPIATHLTTYLAAHGLGHIADVRGGASQQAIAFFSDHDLPFRIRRLRLLARRLTGDWDGPPEGQGGGEVAEEAREKARDAVYNALSLYFDRESSDWLGKDFAGLAEKVFQEPGAVLAGIAARRRLAEADRLVDAMLASAMAGMPAPLRRRMLLAYLGYPFYDTVTLPLLRGEGLTEFDPVKVDRISPDDARSIRTGGTQATLRGLEFYNFGAFFSRAYRENDYLWGRLHGAERMIDLVASALPDNATLSAGEMQAFKREAFLAILDEEETRLQADPGLVRGLREEVMGAA